MAGSPITPPLGSMYFNEHSNRESVFVCGERETERERERERESSIPLSKCLPYLAPTRQYHAAKGTEGRDVEKCFVVQCGEG